MKKQLFRFLFASMICSVFLLTGCTKESTVADPSGTTITNINYTVDQTPVHVWEGLAEDGPYEICPQCVTPRWFSYVYINMGMNNSINFVFDCGSEMAMNSGPYDRNGLGNINGEVADMGKVSGLGNVTDKPNSGWSSSCAVTPGHGYVIRIKKSINYNNTALSYYYGRVYVDRYVLNNSNGIIGAEVKLQYPF